VRAAHERGLRMIGLTHFQSSSAAHPMTVPAFDGQGLTDFGRELVAEMERLRMVVDLAHVNAAGVDEALERMTRPFVVSHSACRGVHDNARNLTDEQIRRMAERGGVIGIAAGRSFVGRPGVSGFLDHVEHALRVGGSDCVAIGSDWDGAIVPVEGMEDVTSLPRITAGLLARGHSEAVIRKVLGENALRVLSEVCG
jgi:membrane dipeptidase